MYHVRSLTLRHTVADTPALATLVEPLLSRAWRKELDKQKVLKGDVDTDLFAIGIGKQDAAQASEEEGSPLQNDSSVLEGPEMAKLKVAKIFDALDLVAVCKREIVEHAIGQGPDSLMECCKVFENK